MKATRAALLVLLTAPFLAAGTPPQEEDQALPLLFFHARELDGRKHREGYRAAADMLRHLRDRQHGLLEAKGFLPQFYEGNMPYFSFAALAAPRDVDRMVQGYLADKEWQRLEDVLWEVTQRQLINDVLFPVAGRQGTGGLIRSWRRSVALEGEFAEALRVARQLTEHLNGLSSSAATQLYVQDVDEFGVLHLITDYDASGAWAERQLRLLEDETYLALVDELNALMKEGSIRTEVLERITF